jgi:hypothetical protein
MSDKEYKYPKRVIEISDYIFANPMANRKDILSKFGKKWQTSTRTLDRLYKEAKKHNETRVKKQQKVKDEVLAEKAKEEIKRDILTREQAQEILTSIAKGRARKIPVKSIIEDGVEKFIEFDLQYPNDGEREKAIAQLAKMEGWEAPTKQEITGKDGAPIIPNHKHVVIFKDYSVKGDDK